MPPELARELVTVARHAGIKLKQTTRFPLPDVTVLREAPEGRYLTGVALIAIEILSEADRRSAIMEKLQEYDERGIPNIWVIDPRRRQLAVFHAGALQPLTLAEIFQA